MTALQSPPTFDLRTVSTDQGDKKRRMAKDRALLDLCQQCWDEGVQAQTQVVGNMSLAQAWSADGRRFLGDHWGDSATARTSGLERGFQYSIFPNDGITGASGLGLKRCTINRTQVGTLANVAAEMALPVTIRLQPEASGDRPQTWILPSGARKLAPILGQIQTQRRAEAIMGEQAVAAGQQPPIPTPQTPLETISPEQMGDGGQNPATMPLDDAQADAVNLLRDQGLLEPDDLCLVNDDFKARCGQRMFDNRWRDAQGPVYLLENVTYRSIFGHEPMRMQLVMCGVDRNRFRFENPNVKSVNIDPTRTKIQDCHYVNYEYQISLDEAIALWPRLEQQFERAKQKGALYASGDHAASVIRNVNFQRPMVRVRISWIRHQPIRPMTPDEAIECGAVEAIMQTTAMPFQLADDAGAPMFDEDGMPAMGMNQVEEVVGYTLLSTGEPITADQVGVHPHWPKYRGLLEVIWLPQLREVVDAYPCKYLDIPIGWNINSPIPYSPYGQSDPRRVADLQDQANRVMTIACIYCGYLAFPQRYWKASVLNSLKEHGVNFHSRPGLDLPLEDTMYDQVMQANGGRPNIHQDIPVIPDMFMQHLVLILQQMDELMGYTSIKQGEAPYAGISGTALDTLTQQAQGPVRLRAASTEEMMERLARIMFDAIVKFCDPELWWKVLDEYPVPIVEEVRRQLAASKHNFYVETATGRGSNQEREDQRTLALYMAGNPAQLISRQDAQERVRVPNPDETNRRIAREQAERMGVTPGMGAEAPQVAAPVK